MRTFLSILLLLVALLGCTRSTAPVIAVPTFAQINEFTTNASIALPASAQPIGWREERGMDDALWLQVRLPASDLQMFLDSSPFRNVTLTANDRYCLTQFQSFFATPPVRYRAGQQSLPNARVLEMLVDEGDAAKVVVYLMWHET